MEAVITSSTNHLKLKHISVVIKKFKDGELYVKVPESVKNKKVVVVSSFPPPAENFLELVFVLDALKRLNCKVHLVITYFGYARQDRVNIAGEACSAEFVARVLKRYADKVSIFDCHSERINRFISYHNIIPIDLFLPFVPKKNLVVVAPDKGAVGRAKAWQRKLHAGIAHLEKSRPAHDVVEIATIKGDVRGRTALIIDDMIATGGTIIEAAKLLKKSGAKDIFVAATHGIFAGDALERLSKAPIKKIFVTDSLSQRKHKLLKVISIKRVLESINRAGF